jgi:hypothetical protein
MAGQRRQSRQERAALIRAAVEGLIARQGGETPQPVPDLQV